MSRSTSIADSAWLSSARFAELAGISGQAARAALSRALIGHQWRGVQLEVRTTRGRGGRAGVVHEISADSLPEELRLKLAKETVLTRPAAHPKPQAARESLWQRYEAAGEKAQTEARRRFEAVVSYQELIARRISRGVAAQTVAQQHDIGRSSLYRWIETTKRWRRDDWLPALLPAHAGRTVKADFSADAWEAIKADYLRPEAPALSACVDRAKRLSKKKDLDWQIPHVRTVQRRIDREIPEPVRVLARDGVEALNRLYPAQERDHAWFQALEAVNADGHKFDVFVRYPDGTVQRPIMVAFQDIFSAKILSYRLDQTENADSVRLAFGDLVETYGIPERAYLDNGRGFASKWMTGGTRTRFRFKVKDEEPSGVFTQLGVDVHWATPYHGQAKPIERAFRDLCEYVAKHPAFAGAYTGNKPTSKPENYGSKAIPLDLFEQVLAEEIEAHNARAGRRSKVCAGQSFDEVFRESYHAREAAGEIRTATEAQRRLWLLAAESVSADRTTGEISLAGNRYWSDFLADHRGKPLVVRFDPDALHDTVFAYTLAGQFIGPCECLHAVGFGDTSKAREHSRQKKRFTRAAKQQLEAHRKMAALTQHVPTEAAPPPTAAQVTPISRPPVEDDDFDAMAAFVNAASRIAVGE